MLYISKHKVNTDKQRYILKRHAPKEIKFIWKQNIPLVGTEIFSIRPKLSHAYTKLHIKIYIMLKTIILGGNEIHAKTMSIFKCVTLILRFYNTYNAKESIFT